MKSISAASHGAPQLCCPCHVGTHAPLPLPVALQMGTTAGGVLRLSQQLKGSSVSHPTLVVAMHCSQVPLVAVAVARWQYSVGSPASGLPPQQSASVAHGSPSTPHRAANLQGMRAGSGSA